MSDARDAGEPVRPDRLEQMLADQLKLQRLLGYDFTAMSPVELVTYLRDMYVAAVMELGEALNETTWKPWTTAPKWVNSTLVLAELGDAFQFIMNMWLAVLGQATPAEVATAMQAVHATKLEVNRRRVAEGYDGVSTKCPSCARALDDPHVTCDGTFVGCTNPGFGPGW